MSRLGIVKRLWFSQRKHHVRLFKSFLVNLNPPNLFSHTIFETSNKFSSFGNKYLSPSSDLNKFTSRTHTCGQVNDSLLGQQVELCGWLEFQRLGKFLVLRDSYGKVQVLIKHKSMQNFVKTINLESVVRIRGRVEKRPEKDINMKLPNGNIEVVVEDELTLLNSAKATMSFLPRDFENVNEVVRLEHRYIDLRRPQMIKNLRIRSKLLMNFRNFLVDRYGFVEIETPTLFKVTPGGAQEFVVPTRFPGQFYSLVQSPQQFKQLLMVGGMDRYFQVARCYRDEGTKANRQPEFTQLDLEMSFTSKNQVMDLVESCLIECWPLSEERSKITAPFMRIDYDQAMRQYGCDKPDLRTLKMKILERKSLNNENSKFYMIVVPEDYDQTFAIKELINDHEQLEVLTNTLHFKGILKHFKYSSLSFQDDLNSEFLEILKNENDFKPNDFIWMAIDGEDENACRRILSRIRALCIELIENEKVRIGSERKLSFLWVENFPLFEWNDAIQQYQSSHHPFTAPSDQHQATTLKSIDPSEMVGQSFDLVINGSEVGGGSIRIADAEFQRYVLENILKCQNQTTMDYFLEALQCGAPPHGGFAIGIDRLLIIICQEKSIRQVIAFPKSAQGKDLMSGAPTILDQQTKQLYNLED